MAWAPMNKNKIVFYIKDYYLGHVYWEDGVDQYFAESINEKFTPESDIEKAKYKIELMAFVKPNTEYRKH